MRFPRRILAAFALFASCAHSGPVTAASEAVCHANLKAAGVAFEVVPSERAVGIDWPIRLLGPVLGVQIYGANKKTDVPTNYLDCRLALALAEWAPTLKREGVVGLQHYSMYRQDAKVGQSSKPSGHASGRAIDIGYFDMSDGRRLSVLDDWQNKKPGVVPCDAAPKTDAERIMRDLVCDASKRELFQVVLTPHYNEAHKNHVHLEIAEERGSWVG